MEDIPFKSDEFTKNQIMSQQKECLVSSWKAVQKIEYELEAKSSAIIWIQKQKRPLMQS